MSRLADVLLQGTHAARPAAAAGNTSYYYWESDTGGLFQSTGSAWVQIAGSSATSVGAVSNAGNTPSLAAGLDSAKPSAGTAGRLYLSTDLPALYRDDGSSWVLMATAAWAQITGKPSTFTPSAHESTHLPGGADAIDWAGSIIRAGTHAARPAAGATNAGTLYYETDTQTLFRSDGSAWTQVAYGAGGYTLPDATTSAIGGVEIDQAPSSGHPIALTTPRLGAASGVASLDANSHVLQQPVDDTTEAATNDTLGATSTITNNLNRIRYQLAQLGTGAWNTLRAMVQLSPSSQQSGTINVSGEVQGSDFKPGGVTGATAAARYHAATTSGAPTSGTWAVGDIVPDQSGKFWMCTGAGTPGTWTQVSGGFSNPMTTQDDIIVGGSSGAATRLAKGTSGQVLTVDSTSGHLAWDTPSGGGGGSSTLAGDTDVAISSPVGGQVLGYNSSTSKWQNQNVAGVAATTQTAQLGADVTLTSANTYYDGPSLTLAPGTWLLIGGVTVEPTGGSTGELNAKLWDGTTVFDAVEETLTAGPYIGSETLSAVVTPTTTTTYKISVVSTVASGKILATTPTGSVGSASKLTAVQLSGNPVGALAPAVRAHSSAAQSTTSGSVTLLTWDTNDTDQGTGTAQHSTSSNTGRLVCQQAGMYVAALWAEFASNATGERLAKIQLNGAGTNSGTDLASARLNADGTTSSPTDLVCTTVPVHLNVGDYLEAYVLQTSGGALNVNGGAGSSQFGMCRVDSGPGYPRQFPAYVEKTANYTLTSSDSMVVAKANSLTFTMLAAANVQAGTFFVIANDNYTGTSIAAGTGDNIAGTNTYSLVAAYSSLTLVSDGVHTWRPV